MKYNNTIKVLMIEDNPGDIVLIREMLDNSELIYFEVMNATRLDDGLKLLVKDNFDVILLDLCLPDSKGIDTFNVMKYNATDIPIIVLSGLKDDIFALSAVERGAQDYLVKGEFTNKQLIRSITYAIERKHIENKLNESDDRFYLAQKAGGIGTFDWNIENDEIIWTDELDKIYGLTSGSFEGKYKSWVELIYPEDRERVKNEQRKSIKNHKDWTDFFRIIWSDKSIHWIKAQAITIYNKKDEPIRMIGVNFDVTDLI
jgi:two-component system, cell cycle sensor histidine kinase and response regulator CckA